MNKATKERREIARLRRQVEFRDEQLKRLQQQEKTDYAQRLQQALDVVRDERTTYRNGLELILELDDSCNYGSGKGSFSICGRIAKLCLEIERLKRGHNEQPNQ